MGLYLGATKIASISGISGLVVKSVTVTDAIPDGDEIAKVNVDGLEHAIKIPSDLVKQSDISDMATKEWTEQQLENISGGMRFVGTLYLTDAVSGDLKNLPISGFSVGDTYKVAEAGTYSYLSGSNQITNTAKIGDTFICLSTSPVNWSHISPDDINVMAGATANTDGSAGLVPAPTSGNRGQYLRGDGSWATPTNTHMVPNYASASNLRSMSSSTGTGSSVLSDVYNSYSPPSNGFICIHKFGHVSAVTNGNADTGYFKINGYALLTFGDGATYNDHVSLLPVAKGDSVYIPGFKNVAATVDQYGIPTAYHGGYIRVSFIPARYV